MRNANGTGSVIKLSGNRRRPWGARKTVGWKINEVTQKAQPVYKFIGYYKTRNEALKALNDYNKSPYSLKGETLEEINEKWFAKIEGEKSNSYLTARRTSWKRLEPLHKKKIGTITRKDIQELLDGIEGSKRVKIEVKSHLRQLYDIAIRYDIIPPEKITVFSYLDLESPIEINKLNRKIFTDEEIETLKSSNKDVAKLLLFLIYTGMRIGEYVNMRPEWFDEENMLINIKKAKTESGIRTVPLPEKAQALLPLKKYSNYMAILREFTVLKEVYNFDHTIYDTRHTCISLLTRRGVDRRVIQSIVGHKPNNVTEEVYTHISTEDMRSALNKI